MKKHVFVIVRFSVIQPGSGAWNSSSSDLQEMAGKIFDYERLAFRFNTFEKFCMQSLMDQKIANEDNIDFTFLILVSDALPEIFKNRLAILKDSFNKNTIHGAMETLAIKSTLIDPSDDSFKNMNEAIKHTIINYANKHCSSSQCSFATVRLDDDDALSDNFITETGKYLSPQMKGMCISFAYGFEGYVDPATLAVNDIRHCYSPKAAQGLAYINLIQNGDVVDKKTFHVLNTNNHTKVDERYPVILDSRMPMYFRALSFTNDSNGSPHHNFLPKVMGKPTLNMVPCLTDKITDTLSHDVEDFFALEISKKASHAAAMISNLNNKITIIRNSK